MVQLCPALGFTLQERDWQTGTSPAVAKKRFLELNSIIDSQQCPR